MNTGLNEYFNDHGHGDYVVYLKILLTTKALYGQVTQLNGYLYRQCPVPNHAVLGIGTSVTYMIGHI